MKAPLSVQKHFLEEQEEKKGFQLFTTLVQMELYQENTQETTKGLILPFLIVTEI